MVLCEVLNDRILFMKLMEFALCHFFNGFVRRVDDFDDSIFIARLELSVDISEVVPIKSYLLASDFRK